MRGRIKMMRLIVNSIAFALMTGSVSFAASDGAPLMTIKETDLKKTLQGKWTIGVTPFLPIIYPKHKTANGKSAHGSKISIKKADLEEQGLYVDKQGYVRKQIGDAQDPEYDDTIHGLGVYLNADGGYEYHYMVDGGSLGYQHSYTNADGSRFSIDGIPRGLSRDKADKALRDWLKKNNGRYRVEGDNVYDAKTGKFLGSINDFLNDYEQDNQKPGRSTRGTSSRGPGGGGYRDDYNDYGYDNGGGGGRPRNYYDDYGYDNGGGGGGRAPSHSSSRGPGGGGGGSSSRPRNHNHDYSNNYDEGGRDSSRYPSRDYGSDDDLIARMRAAYNNGSGGAGYADSGRDYGPSSRSRPRSTSGSDGMDFDSILNALRGLPNAANLQDVINAVSRARSGNGNLSPADLDVIIAALQASPDAAKYKNLIDALIAIRNAQNGSQNPAPGGALTTPDITAMTAEEFLAYMNGQAPSSGGGGKPTGNLVSISDAAALIEMLMRLGNLSKEDAEKLANSGAVGSPEWESALIAALMKANNGKLDLPSLEEIMKRARAAAQIGPVNSTPGSDSGRSTSVVAANGPRVVHWEASIGGDHLQVPGKNPGEYLYLKIGPDGRSAFDEADKDFKTPLYIFDGKQWVPTPDGKKVVDSINKALPAGESAFISFKGQSGSEIREFRFPTPISTKDPDLKNKVSGYIDPAKSMFVR
jgi:hypothetical protein